VTVVDVSSLVMCLMSTAIGNAFAVLSDAQKRKRYDEFGSDDTELRRRRHPNGYDYDFSRGFEGKYHDSLCVFSCVHAACMSCSLHVSIKKGAYSSSWKTHLRTTACRLPYGFTQCYLSPDTGEHTPP